ncbi:hypothetical protein HMPREF1624_05675 [Sporothrix schenckii ATCC 58251]|uniref:Indoleamine 2,3-dioxygenase n=1 Tax=Sporothrix schenckii (strain ATCC 58251 / de Perez 2211183) TaxID=1391915 RepID=U7PPJ8_SPOS1|nr:hypothetical protein HMPREF1624_05675 [Sporothrix schenckii ATCC 58251]
MDTAFTHRYGLSDNGFLPPQLPLATLPDPYYAPWEAIIRQLPALLQANRLRNEVDRLPILSVHALRSEPEWRRAYLILAFLTHAYIWGDDVVADVLPPCIAVPLLAVADHLELPPVATYAALNLWNFTTEGTGDMPFDQLDRLHALHTFTGTESESWFYVVSVAMEYRAAKIVPVLLQAQAARTNADIPTVTAALRRFVPCVQDIGRLLDRMHERCDPSIFFFQIRPFLAGSKHMAAQGLPNGVFYDEGDGRGAWRQLRGGSNGQSSLLQFFDIVLGVEHTSNGCHGPGANDDAGEQGFHEEVRGYMPGPHRRFLEHVAARPSIRHFVMQATQGAALTDDQKQLAAAFADTTKALAAFRDKHLAIVARYIILPSRQKAAMEAKAAAGDEPASKLRGLAHMPSRTDGAEILTGTGGTELMPFLKQTRDETLQAGVLTAPISRDDTKYDAMIIS